MDKFTIKEILGFIVFLQVMSISTILALIFDAISVRKELTHLYKQLLKKELKDNGSD